MKHPSLRTFQQRFEALGHSLVGWELLFDNIRMKVVSANKNGELMVQLGGSGMKHDLRASSWSVIQCKMAHFTVKTLVVK